jgi:hypothetical protein
MARAVIAPITSYSRRLSFPARMLAPPMKRPEKAMNRYQDITKIPHLAGLDKNSL